MIKTAPSRLPGTVFGKPAFRWVHSGPPHNVWQSRLADYKISCITIRINFLVSCSNSLAKTIESLLIVTGIRGETFWRWVEWLQAGSLWASSSAWRRRPRPDLLTRQSSISISLADRPISTCSIWSRMHLPKSGEIFSPSRRMSRGYKSANSL